jgi:hypothetical protein
MIFRKRFGGAPQRDNGGSNNENFSIIQIFEKRFQISSLRARIRRFEID